MASSFTEASNNETAEDNHSPGITTAYPPKPLPEYKKQGNQLFKFLISVLLFGVVYYFYAGTQWQAIVWLVIIIFLHELGHYLAMKFFKYEDLTIFFIPLLGAVAGGSKEKISQKEKAIVLLAGPLPGIIIGIVLFLIAENTNDYLMLRLSYAFVLLNILNLLPIYPLDGGQLLKTLFLNSKETVSFIFILLSILLAIWFAISRQQWFLLIIPYFLLVRMYRQLMIGRIRRNLDKASINYYQNYGELADEEYWKIRDEVAATNPMLAESVTPGDYSISEKEGKMIDYIKSVVKTSPAVDLSITGKIIILFLWVASFVLPFLLMRPAHSYF